MHVYNQSQKVISACKVLLPAWVVIATFKIQNSMLGVGEYMVPIVSTHMTHPEWLVYSPLHIGSYFGQFVLWTFMVEIQAEF
jgi:hypothetical protein